MDVLTAANHYSKFLFPFLEYDDIINFLCSHRFLYNLFIHQSRQITLSFKGFQRFLQSEPFRERILSNIVDSSKQLSINFLEIDQNEESIEGKEALLESVKTFFPYYLLEKQCDFPSLLKLTCNRTLYLYLCEKFPSFTVRKLDILLKENIHLTSYISLHLPRVSEELVQSWPRDADFPPLSLTLMYLHLDLENSNLNSLPYFPNLKHLRIENYYRGILDLRSYYSLDTLELIKVEIVDFTYINPCKKLLIHFPLDVLHPENISEYEQIDFKQVYFDNLTTAFKNVKVMKFDYPKMSLESISIDLNQLTQLERVELSCDGVDEVILGNGSVSPRLKFMKLNSCLTILDMSVFSHLYEVFLYNCRDVESLEGLRNVPRVLLHCLEIESLEGLGNNDYVYINTNEYIEDFSPLKDVREVKLEYCDEFSRSADLSHVKKLTIVECEAIEDLSGLTAVEELYLENCPKIVRCPELDSIPKFSFLRCEGLNKEKCPPIAEQDFGDRVMSDDLTKLPDSLHPEILKYLNESDQMNMISSNCHFYQRFIKKIGGNLIHRYMREDSFTIMFQTINTDKIEIPLNVKDLCFQACRFNVKLAPITGLKKLEFRKCSNMKTFTDFFGAEEVIIDSISVGDSLDIVSLSRVKRLTLLECEYMNDYTPLQDVEEINIRYGGCGSDIIFQGSKAFAYTRKIKLFFEFSMKIEMDLAFYQNVEVFEISGSANFTCNGPCPINLRKLKISRSKDILLPSNLDHLHLLHIRECRQVNLDGVGLIPNIKLAKISLLTSLEGLGPSNQFVQLLHLNKVTDFSPVSRSRKVVIWDCPKFKDASPFVNADYLVIGECHGLTDVSMLGRVRHLELINCKNIRSIEGLERVKELIVDGCRLVPHINTIKRPAWSVFDDSDTGG